MRFPTKDTERWQEIRVYLLSHYTYETLKQMGDRFGVSKVSVGNWLRKLGLKKPHVKKGISPELAADIKRLWDAGLSRVKVARTLGIPEFLVKKYVRWVLGGVRQHEYFFHQLTPASVYVLGFFFADGNLYPREGHKDLVRFYQMDEAYIRELQAIVGGGLVTQSSQSGIWELRICSDVMSVRLQELGLCARKSYTDLHVPEEITDEVFPHFLRGLVDGDGCIRFTHGCPTVVLVGGKTLLRGCADRVQRLVGHRGKLSVCCKKGRLVSTPAGVSEATIDTYSLYYGRRSGVECVLDWLYSGTGPALVRKRKIALRVVGGSEF